MSRHKHSKYHHPPHHHLDLILGNYLHFTHGQLAMCYGISHMVNWPCVIIPQKNCTMFTHFVISTNTRTQAIGLPHQPSATTYQAIGLLHHISSHRLLHIFSRYCRPYCLILFLIFCLRVYFYITVCSVA